MDGFEYWPRRICNIRITNNGHMIVKDKFTAIDGTRIEGKQTQHYYAAILKINPPQNFIQNNEL